MDTIEFLRQDENGKTHIVIDTTKSDPTWWEIVDRFVDFINGCGFQVTWEDLRDYCDEQSWEPDSQRSADQDTTLSDYEDPWTNNAPTLTPHGIIFGDNGRYPTAQVSDPDPRHDWNSMPKVSEDFFESTTKPFKK